MNIATNDFELIGSDLTTLFNTSRSDYNYFLDPFFDKHDQFVIKQLWEIPILEERAAEIFPDKLYMAYVTCHDVVTDTIITCYIALLCENNVYIFWRTCGIYTDIHEAIFSAIAYVYMPQPANNDQEYKKQLMRVFQNYRVAVSMNNFNA